MSKGDVVVVDVRDAPELATGGKIKGAVHVPRGMLEFRADPESPYHNPALRKEKTAVLYCASGGRSALAGKTLQERSTMPAPSRIWRKRVWRQSQLRSLSSDSEPTASSGDCGHWSVFRRGCVYRELHTVLSLSERRSNAHSRRSKLSVHCRSS